MAVVKANYVRKGGGERVTAKANIRYIQERPGRGKEKLTRPLFNNAGVLGRLEAYQFIDEAAKQGRYFYRLKLSPDPNSEDTKRDLNMQKLTRQMMQRLEKRLKTTIPWAGALHMTIPTNATCISWQPYRGNLVNTSVTSVDTSAACASGRGMLASPDTLAEPPIVCTPMRGGWW
jgi:hypothetical protein